MTDVAHHFRRSVLDQDLQDLRERILAMGEQVDSAISRCTEALVKRDLESADALIRDDAKVNASQAAIRDIAFTAILTQAPVARDLREIIGYFHMAGELERMADHCVNVARMTRDVIALPELASPPDISRLAELCASQVREMLNAVVARDVERARQVAAGDEKVNHLYHTIVDDLLHAMAEDGSVVYVGTKLMMIALNLERIGDRVTNLAEDLVFLETGGIEDLG